MSKLKNLKAVREMLSGDHRTQRRKSFGFQSDYTVENEKNKVRAVGEIWEEDDGTGRIIEWEQKQGYRVKRSKNLKAIEELRDYLAKFPNCPKETCTCKQPSRLDFKFKAIMGMCHDCVLSMETKMKLEGTWNDYAINKMKSNAQSFFEQADKEMAVLLRGLDNPSYWNGDGTEEKWEVEDKEAMIEKIKSEYEKFKQDTISQFEVKE